MKTEEIMHIRKLYEEYEEKCNDENTKVVELMASATTLIKYIPNLLEQIEARQELLQMTVDTFDNVKEVYSQISDRFKEEK
ncbi:hypothetical protein IEO_03069 [Bacillus wiedmannii]|uniref:hypothetical protein n=1 Tax=Bacillus wiedmannii TaxID=1890302 RepID=UPI00027C0165|nr:hypothetical protein [Bacillus wiedmannii]EJV61774.1 hypothetical protein IEO_03069 [Bacillus wiedmannii]